MKKVVQQLGILRQFDRMEGGHFQDDPAEYQRGGDLGP